MNNRGISANNLTKTKAMRAPLSLFLSDPFIQPLQHGENQKHWTPDTAVQTSEVVLSESLRQKVGLKAHRITSDIVIGTSGAKGREPLPSVNIVL